MSGSYRENILIVEEDKITALDLLRRLERFGYEVVGTALNAGEARAIAAEQRPGLVLADLMLGGTPAGVDLAIELRRSLGCGILFVTSYADPEVQARALLAEPYGYVFKPFKERELFASVDMALYKMGMERRQREREHHFSAILHSISEGIIATDTDLDVQYLNPQASAFTGVSEDEARGKPVGSICSLVDSATGREVFGSPFAPETVFPVYLREAVVRDRAGKQTIVDCSLSRIKEEGNPSEGYLLTMRDITELKHLSAEIDYQASHDTLTGLLNRDEFSKRLEELLRSPPAEGEGNTLLVADIDHFKVINDTCGTSAGDALLKQVAGYLEGLTSRNDPVARMGGDEFGVLLRGCRAENAEQVARRLQTALLDEGFDWDEESHVVTLSIGVVPVESAGPELRDVLEACDDACAMAREAGGGRVSLYHRGDQRYERRRDEKIWIGRITLAAEEDRFRLFRQPILPLDPASGHRQKQEILVRMAMEDGRLALPGEFIPAAERYSLMRTLDRWVVRASLRSIRDLRQRNAPIADSIFCVNLSGQSLLDESFADFILEEIARNALPGSSICIEITETSAIQNLGYATRFIDALKARDLTISLDDFGSGFSSFGYLQRLPVDYLKIDGSFVKAMAEDKVSRTMVESINSLGHTMGLRTVAEFVTSPAILEGVRSIGVDYAQGYAISAPVPLNE